MNFHGRTGFGVARDAYQALYRDHSATLPRMGRELISNLLVVSREQWIAMDNDNYLSM